MTLAGETTMTTQTNLSARECAAVILAGKPKADVKAAVERVAYMAGVSGKSRWTNLHAAVQAKDTDRLAYYAAAGDEKRALGKALPPKDKPAKPAARKAAAKKPAAAAKPQPTQGRDALVAALAEKLANASDEKLAAFTALL